jgi:hypothetical protein
MAKKKNTKKATAPVTEGEAAADAFTPAVNTPTPAVKANGSAFVSMSISLPAETAAAVRALQTGLVPGLELGLSEAVRYAIQLGLIAHKTGHTVRDFEEL